MDADNDEGDHTHPAHTRRILLLILILVLACHRPPTLTSGVQHHKLLLAEDRGNPKQHLPKAKKKKKKKLYITFDDGPNKGTKNVLDIVRDEQVNVTFFVVGQHVFASRTQAALWDSMNIATNVEICNHSYSHAKHQYSQFYKNVETVIDDFERTHDSLLLDNRIARTPGRNVWRIDTLNFTDLKTTKAAADSLEKAGFVLMGWDVEWHYNHKTMSVACTADELIRCIDSVFYHNKTMKEDHLVLLAHDQVYQKPDDSIQLRQFLQKLKQKDEYDIAFASSYPGALNKPGSDSIR